jgi:hypothetical protein
MLLRHVLRHQLPRHDPAVDFRLEHGEDIAVDLRFVRDERTRRVQDAGIDLPACARLQPKRA